MLWTVARQVPLSVGFSRQDYWNGLPIIPPGVLPDPRIEPASLMSPALTGSSLPLATWKAHFCSEQPHILNGLLQWMYISLLVGCLPTVLWGSCFLPICGNPSFRVPGRPLLDPLHPANP